MAATKVQIPLKVMIHKVEERVVFAEANSDFVDILLSFLTMPMGTIVRLLSKHSNASVPPAIGSFNNLYESIGNLDAKYFASEHCKDMLLNTRNSAEAVCRKLKINIDDIKPIEYFTCDDMLCTDRNYTAYVSISNCHIKCKNCSKFLNRKAYFSCDNVKDQCGVFVPPTATFVITDDLHVFPDFPASTLALLKNSGITDLGVLVEKTYNIGHTEIIDLLKYSIFSKTPLTSLFLGKKYIFIDKSVQTISRHLRSESNFSFKNMTVKLLFQKSNKKILLAVSEEDFAGFLFSFLSIPLGSVIYLLTASHASTTIVAENLHKSVSELCISRYFKSQELKDMLICPQLAEHYLSSNLMFPLAEAVTPELKCKPNCFSYSLMYAKDIPKPKSGQRGMAFKNPVKINLVNPRGSEKIMNAHTMYMVTDDLVVSPLSSTSCLKYLKRLKVSAYDVEEQVVDIGITEALNLLKATLNSTSVLNKGLKNALLKSHKFDK